MIALMTFGLGIVYPIAVTAVAGVLFPHEATGSLIEVRGIIVGSELIGQRFESDRYFHGRPSAAADGYDAIRSGGSNLGPTNSRLIERIRSAAEDLGPTNPARPIPADLVMASGSGLDPDISPAAAGFQVPRIARSRGIPEAKLWELIASQTTGRDLGFLGEPQVNVLRLNIALDSLAR